MAILKKLRGIGRLLYFAAYSSYIIAKMIFLNILRGTHESRSMRIRKGWARHLLSSIGVKMDVRGDIPDITCILMGNHRSYLDPAVLMYDTIACPVSKAEVAKWPIVGYGAKVSGVIFLQRESTTSRKRTLAGIAAKLKEGVSVILFPEGTTHSDPKCHELKAGGFKLAAQENIPIVPVAIDYGSVADYWVGDDTFLPHFIRQFSEKEIRVFVRYGPVLQSDDPEYLRTATRNWIDNELEAIRKSF